MGKFCRILEPGLNFLIPFLDRIGYVQSLKELAIDIPKQSAVTLGELKFIFYFFIIRYYIYLFFFFCRQCNT